MILNTVCEKENFKMIRMKENYYIKKYYGDFVLLKRAKNKEKLQKSIGKSWSIWYSKRGKRSDHQRDDQR